ncbi:hypothetical protein [Streptomyces sp. NPDC058861]|uniref:hypothetical protein n=1 Tax=Streptomyces sp. NPDC058861 TaxID=3346653 RepID=UPI0036BC07ED
MGGKITYVFLSTVLVLVFGVVGMEGVLLLLTGEPAAMGMGAVAFLLPLVGGWFLWKNTRFAGRARTRAPARGGAPRRRPAAAQARAAVTVKAPRRAAAGSRCADMDECPTAAKATHTAANSAARRARRGDRASVIARHGVIPPSGRTDPPRPSAPSLLRLPFPPPAESSGSGNAGPPAGPPGRLRS